MLQAAINRRTTARIKVLRALSVDIVKVAADSAETADERKYDRQVDKLYGLNMQIFRRKFSMTFLMNLMYHLGTIGILTVGSWLVLQGKTEIGTIVAFISGISRMNDPWGDLVNYFRDLTNTGVRFRMIMSTVDQKGS
jgi:ABC-type bacteriocin/lantibiotic exporter with double-glycine peptidase domain